MVTPRRFPSRRHGRGLCRPPTGIGLLADLEGSWPRTISRSRFGRHRVLVPPVSKTYGTICVLTTTLFHLGLVNPYYIALIYSEVFQHFQACP
ncbi:hypothetical protein EJ110_NYTH29163 [Nymphaea thermarum]|nr:hypothetical protein EJ110_NYTH29163 [Nymphaea thermarum]